MRIAEGVYVLEVSASNGAIHPVLLSDEDRLILVDTGFPGQIVPLTEAVQEAGFRLEDLTDVILTHQDIDHIGCVTELSDRAPGLRFWVHEQEAPYLDGRETPLKLAGLLERYDELPDDGKAWCDQLKVGFANRQLKALDTLKDGEIIPVCGGVETVHTPGHTPGHICLFLRDSKIMVCGDAANIRDGELVGSNPEYTWDMPLAERSLERIKSYGALGAVCYHCGYMEL